MDIKSLLEQDFKTFYNSRQTVTVNVTTWSGDFTFFDSKNCYSNCKRIYNAVFATCSNRGDMIACHSEKTVYAVQLEKVFHAYLSDVKAVDDHCKPDYLAYTDDRFALIELTCRVPGQEDNAVRSKEEQLLKGLKILLDCPAIKSEIDLFKDKHLVIGLRIHPDTRQTDPVLVNMASFSTIDELRPKTTVLMHPYQEYKEFPIIKHVYPDVFDWQAEINCDCL